MIYGTGSRTADSNLRFERDCQGRFGLWQASHMEGKAGFVTSATEKELIVQYHPGIGNVTNHFRIPIDEAVDAQWEIRYSHDMSEVKTYGIEKQDTEEGATE